MKKYFWGITIFSLCIITSFSFIACNSSKEDDFKIITNTNNQKNKKILEFIAKAYGYSLYNISKGSINENSQSVFEIVPFKKGEVISFLTEKNKIISVSMMRNKKGAAIFSFPVDTIIDINKYYNVELNVLDLEKEHSKEALVLREHFNYFLQYINHTSKTKYSFLYKGNGHYSYYKVSY